MKCNEKNYFIQSSILSVYDIKNDIYLELFNGHISFCIKKNMIFLFSFLVSVIQVLLWIFR